MLLVERTNKKRQITAVINGAVSEIMRAYNEGRSILVRWVDSKLATGKYDEEIKQGCPFCEKLYRWTLEDFLAAGHTLSADGVIYHRL